MSDTTTPERASGEGLDLESLRKLAEAATPGPWVTRERSHDFLVKAEVPRTPLDGTRTEIIADFGGSRRGYDVEFVVAAREALPSLIDLVERLRAHPPHPTLQRDLPEDEFSTGQLIEFLREAAGRDGIGAWRAKEFAQAADRLQEYEDAYLAVCPYEAEVERLRAENASLRAAPPAAGETAVNKVKNV